VSDPEPIGNEVQAQAARLAERQQSRPRPQAKPSPVLPDASAMFKKIKQAADEAWWVDTVPRKYQGADVENFEPVVRDGLVRWADRAESGVNLLIFGPVGTGKTHAAFAAARQMFERGAYFARWPEYRLKAGLDYRDPEGARLVRDEVCCTRLLVLDDLGAHKPNDWWVGEVFGIVEHRWEDDLPTIVTTNLDPPHLAEAIGERTYSRLTAAPAVAVRLSGNDRRMA